MAESKFLGVDSINIHDCSKDSETFLLQKKEEEGEWEFVYLGVLRVEYTYKV